MIWLVMGVIGCGKTTLGRAMAERLKIPFYDADDFHPSANREKLQRDQPLTDVDRRPWLESLAAQMAGWEKSGGAVLACSALKESYRHTLANSGASMKVIWVQITPEQAKERLMSRQHDLVGKFEKILKAQFADLEAPKNAVVVAANLPTNRQLELALSGRNSD